MSSASRAAWASQRKPFTFARRQASRCLCRAVAGSGRRRSRRPPRPCPRFRPRWRRGRCRRTGARASAATCRQEHKAIARRGPRRLHELRLAFDELAIERLPVRWAPTTAMLTVSPCALPGPPAASMTGRPSWRRAARLEATDARRRRSRRACRRRAQARSGSRRRECRPARKPAGTDSAARSIRLTKLV